MNQTVVTMIVGIVLTALGSYGMTRYETRIKGSFTIGRMLIFSSLVSVALFGVMLLASIVPLLSIIKFLAKFIS